MSITHRIVLQPLIKVVSGIIHEAPSFARVSKINVLALLEPSNLAVFIEMTTSSKGIMLSPLDCPLKECVCQCTFDLATRGVSGSTDLDRNEEGNDSERRKELYSHARMPTDERTNQTSVF